MDQVSLGVLVEAVPRFKVDQALNDERIRALRSDGKLPPHVTAYLTMAMALFAQDAAEEVATRVTGSLDAFGVWDASWSVPTSSGITQARKRLGPDVLRRVFEYCAVPVAVQDETRGAFACGLRVMAIDGFAMDVPDTPGNAAEFGYSTTGGNPSAFPKVRVVGITECASHCFVDARIGPYTTGEQSLAAPLLARLDRSWLLTADRGFYSFPAFSDAAETGAGLLWRVKADLRLPPLRVLEDGTYVSVVIDREIRGARREAIVRAAEAGEELDPHQARRVRVVQYDVPDRAGPAGTELICLITNLLDPQSAPAEVLAYCYHQRWEQESAHDQLETDLRGSGRVLRSRLPDLVYQEVWAYLLVHYAINALICRAATGADIDPDRVSFVKAVRIARRTATGTARFSP
ncbi:IS4 family transposase [Actinospica robiniae]|uniref:IS4 family transposase n=1 Tax=Actinospica robiniae TaxID=304901 RepID=UPI000688C3BC|nr:IS4 family transposase [Actinospica robiniae]